jgi:hypothetical protein
LTLYCLPGWAVLNAVLALPAVIWRRSRRAEVIASLAVWAVFTACYVLLGISLYESALSEPGYLIESDARATAPPLHVNMALDFVVFVVVPQTAAMLASLPCKYRAFRPVFAAGFSVFGLVVYYAGGIITGAEIG